MNNDSHATVMPHVSASAPDRCICEFEYCVCERAERALHMFRHGDEKMTPEQREECLEQIGAVEGYERSDYEKAPDAELAHMVLCAWTDYCRDKGLL